MRERCKGVSDQSRSESDQSKGGSGLSKGRSDQSKGGSDQIRKSRPVLDRLQAQPRQLRPEQELRTETKPELNVKKMFKYVKLLIIFILEFTLEGSLVDCDCHLSNPVIYTIK